MRACIEVCMTSTDQPDNRHDQPERSQEIHPRSPAVGANQDRSQCHHQQDAEREGDVHQRNGETPALPGRGAS